MDSILRWSASGWRPPTELPGSTQPRIGGGKQAAGGGVPTRGNPRKDDTTALGADVWQWARIGAAAAGPASSLSLSSSSSSGVDSKSAHLVANALLEANQTLGDPSRYDFTLNTFVCRALTDCEPCPPTSRNHPFCRPYGNRKLVSCSAMLDFGRGSSSTSTNTFSSPGAASSLGVPGPYQDIVHQPPAGANGAKPAPPADEAFIGWEACGKVVHKESRDYMEFVLILILLALASLYLLVRRNRELHRWQSIHGYSSATASSRAAPRRRRARLG